MNVSSRCWGVGAAVVDLVFSQGEPVRLEE